MDEYGVDLETLVLVAEYVFGHWSRSISRGRTAADNKANQMMLYIFSDHSKDTPCPYIY